MRNLAIGIAGLAYCVSASPTLAQEICKGKVLRDIASFEDATRMLPKDHVIVALTQYWDNGWQKKFCQQGGYCYPAFVEINDETEKSIELLNCKIQDKPDSVDEYGSSSEKLYNLEIVRASNSNRDLRFYDVQMRLVELGFALATVRYGAAMYVDEPDSKCAQLVRRVLENNPQAIAELRQEGCPD